MPVWRYPYPVFYVEPSDTGDVWRVLRSKRDILAWLREHAPAGGTQPPDDVAEIQAGDQEPVDASERSTLPSRNGQAPSVNHGALRCKIGNGWEGCSIMKS